MIFSLFRMVLFGDAHGLEGGGGDWGQICPPSKNLSHISYNDETWHSPTLPEKDLEKSKSRDTPLENPLDSPHSFTENQQLLLYQEIQMSNAF